MDKGDVLFVYSDGLTEAEDSSGNMFGEERVKEIILREAPFRGGTALRIYSRPLFRILRAAGRRATTSL